MAGSESNVRSTTGNCVSRASIKDANALRRSADLTFVSCNTFRKDASASLLPKVSDNCCANCRTSAFGLLASFGATSAQPLGGFILRCPLSASAMPLRISN